MKYILLIFLVIFCFQYTGKQAYATEPRECQTGQYCAIKNETNPDLQIYLDSNKQVIRNLTQVIKSRGTQGKADDNLKNLWRNIIGFLNQEVDWRRYNTLFDFYVSSSIDGSLPSAVYRDYQKLIAEGERINKLMHMFSDELYNDMLLTNEEICAGITTKCTLNGKPIKGLFSQVLGKLHENNTAIKVHFQLTTLGNEQDHATNKQKYIFLVDTSISGNTDISATNYFEEQIEKFYGANAIAECNQCDGGSFLEIKESINNISQTLEKLKKGYKGFKEPGTLLVGAKEDTRRIQNERQLLERELSRQGLKTSSAEVILQNLDEYNNPENENGRVTGFTWGNNYISNSYKSFVDDTNVDLNNFSSAIESEFRKDSGEEDTSELYSFTTLEDLRKTQNKINNSAAIAQEIHELYKLQEEHAQQDDIRSNTLIRNILATHLNLVEALKVIDRTIRISESVCNSQGAGLGNCSYGNHK